MLGNYVRRALGFALTTCVLCSLEKQAQSQSLWVTDESQEVSALVYPPKDPARPQRLFVMLHGMCDEPENECPHFADAVTEHGFLICPRAETRCDGGGSIWHHVRGHETVERSVQLVLEKFPSQIDESTGRTLIGFSLGALFGLRIVQRPDNKYSHALLIGAKVMPNIALLKRARVQKLALAAGRFDMMHDHMQHASQRLLRSGFRAHFEPLGKVGHWFPPDLATHLNTVFTWFDEHGPASDENT